MPGITAMESLQFSVDSLTLLLIVVTLNLEKIVEKYLLNDFYCNEQTSFPSDVFLCEYRTQFYHTTIHKALDRLLLKNIRQKSLCKGLCTAVSRAVQTCTVLRAVS